jgi:hypothetical protein
MSKGTIADPRPCAATASPPSKRLAKKGILTRAERALNIGLSAATVTGVVLLGLAGNATAQPASNAHFTIVTIGDAPGTVVASGAVRGIGTETDNEDSADPVRPFNATLQFPQGALTERVADTAPPKAQFDPITCVLKTLEQQHFTAVGATGTLAGTTGSGTATVSTTIIEARGSNGACAQHAPPLLVLVIVHETGTLAVSGPSPN